MNSFPEKDWKQLRSIQQEKLALVCGQILEETARIASAREGGEHQAFLKVWEVVNEGSAQIAELFDDVRRSTALQLLVAWRRNGLINEEELALFSEETQAAIRQAEQWQR